MSKKLQCQDCGQAEYGEDLYNYDNKILCRYCIVSRVCEGSTPCEYVGTCNDKTYPNKADQIDQLKQQLAEKDKKLLEFKRDRLYFELLLTRLQWLHKKADDYRQEKERFGIADMSLSSVWDVLELKKNDLCEYEEMCALQEGIECVANSKLLGDIEHDLQVKTTRSEDEIFKDIDKIDLQIKELKGEKE